jgi:Holliday junction resolvase RusA-like endonuclease
VTVLRVGTNNPKAPQVITILGINPEPWETGTISAGRRKTGGGFTATMAPSQKLQAYQEALREYLDSDMRWSSLDPDARVTVEFFFFRQIETFTSPVRKWISYGHEADATNLQKATEDALQGRLFTNDNLVRDVRSVILSQGVSTEPALVIRVKPFIDQAMLYSWVEEQVAEERARQSVEHDNSW